MRHLVVLSLALVFLPAVQAGPKSTHTGTYKTRTFDVHYRPGSRAGAAVERDAACAERDFADICGKLEFTPAGRFDIYLYDDVPELMLISGVKGVGGFTCGRETHLPQGNDQTRYHELVHLVEVQIPKTGEEERSMFFMDGLANALLVHVHGVHVHAVAKYYRQRKKLPKLETFLTGDFYAWLRAHPGFNAYDVGGSYIRYLLDTYGVENVMRYYSGTSAKRAFGVSASKVEMNWLVTLDAFVLRPEVETLLAQRDGEAAKFTHFEADPDKRIPAELLGKPSEWKSLMREKSVFGAKDCWRREGDAIAGSRKGGWNVHELGSKKYGDCAIRARIETKDIFGGVQLRLGNGCCAMLVANGTFIYRDDQPVASSARERAPATGEVDLMLVRRTGRMEVWVNGIRVVEGPVDATPHLPGIAFHTGTALFRDVRVRVLK